MRRARAPTAAMLLVLAACEQEIATTVATQPVGDMHETMTWVIDPAADVIWGSAGFVLTEDGEQDLAPLPRRRGPRFDIVRRWWRRAATCC